MKRKLKTAYSRTRVKSKTHDPKTKCVQSEKHNSDVNNIVAKAHKTGQLPTLMNRQPMEQMPDVETYQDALNKVVFAQQQFERLPSNIRQEFDNDPTRLMSALQDKKQRKKLGEMGIIEQKEPKNEMPPAEEPAEPKTPEEKPPAGE